MISALDVSDMFPDDDFDDFIADDKDEALSEPQLIAMLDIIECKFAYHNNI